MGVYCVIFFLGLMKLQNILCMYVVLSLLFQANKNGLKNQFVTVEFVFYVVQILSAARHLHMLAVGSMTAF